MCGSLYFSLAYFSPTANAKSLRELVKRVSMVQLPEEVPPFIHICQNDFLGRKCKKLKDEDIAICECKYDGNDPDSACGDRCLNVLTSTECTPGYCPCGDYCKNQRFQKCEYAKMKLFKTEGRGWGLLADENIKAGQFIIEYCGEVISSDEAKGRSQDYEAQGLKDAYIISLNANYFIDATKKGSLARFINHSCQPNCETRKWTVLGEIRVGIFAKQDICAGTELAYNYNFEWYGGATVRCLCGAPNCSIFLGAKSPAFLEQNHVWVEGDDRLWLLDEEKLGRKQIRRLNVLFQQYKEKGEMATYTVEEIPLYDSAEDEPSLKPSEKKIPFGPDILATRMNDLSAVLHGNVGYENPLGSSSAEVEPQFLVPTEGMGMNTVKSEEIEEKLYSQETQQAFANQNAMISRIRSNSACRNYQIGSASVPKKRSPHIPNKRSRQASEKQIDGKSIAKLFVSKEAQEEIIESEERKIQAASKLDSLYEEIRPAINEHERDSQDNVDIGVAQKWINASCAKMKAEFDFHFSIVKNVLCPPFHSAGGEARPSGAGDNNNNETTLTN
ncbi:Histone-lysine N-methyltransferase [Bertholletia excelsa]